MGGSEVSNFSLRRILTDQRASTSTGESALRAMQAVKLELETKMLMSGVKVPNTAGAHISHAGRLFANTRGGQSCLTFVAATMETLRGRSEDHMPGQHLLFA